MFRRGEVCYDELTVAYNQPERLEAYIQKANLDEADAEYLRVLQFHGHITIWDKSATKSTVLICSNDELQELVENIFFAPA